VKNQVYTESKLLILMKMRPFVATFENNNNNNNNTNNFYYNYNYLNEHWIGQVIYAVL